MKKGNSKNRHFSKGINKCRKNNSNFRGHKERKTSSSNTQHDVKIFKWRHIGTIIQLADFLIDKVPLLAKWLFSLLGMG